MNGTESDHQIIAASFGLPKHPASTSTQFSFRPITTRGVEKFGTLLLDVNWDEVIKSDASESATNLNNILQEMVEQCFELKTRTIQSSDAPWMDRKSKKLLNRKRRIYKKEGKSQKYHDVSRLWEIAVAEAKSAFLQRVVDKTKAIKNTRCYYKAVNVLKTKEAPAEFDVCTMYPGSTVSEVSEYVAEFFNVISQEYESLPNPRQRNSGEIFVQPLSLIHI